MWFKHRAWMPVAWLIALGNLGAIWFAAFDAEPWHATIHGALAAGFALGARHLTLRGRRDALSDGLQQSLDDMQGHVEELEERVDFAERLLAAERDPARPGAHPGPGA